MKLVSVRNLIALSFILLPLFSFSQISRELQKVGKLMQGKFSSEKQSLMDSAFFDIRMNISPIWCDRTDAIWLYVEQAISNKTEMPYRQRVYKLTQMTDGSFECAVLTMSNPLRYAGNVKLLNHLNPDSLELHDGCSVFLKKIDKKLYEGSTTEKTCASDMRGAFYASSSLSISPKMLLTLDRGFDRFDKQVWGAEKDGYRFLRVRK